MAGHRDGAVPESVDPRRGGQTRPRAAEQLSDGRAEQRVQAHARLAPLALHETRDYIRLRLDAAGARGQPIFDDDAIAAVFDAGAGVPRRLNRIASAAMIVAASCKKNIVTAQDVHDARIDRGRA